MLISIMEDIGCSRFSPYKGVDKPRGMQIVRTNFDVQELPKVSKWLHCHLQEL